MNLTRHLRAGMSALAFALCPAFALAQSPTPATPALSATVKAVTASYTALNADDRTTLNLNAGSTANQIVTVSALSSYSDAAYTLGVCNRDSRPWKIVSADAGTLKLYPGQCNMLLPKAGQLAFWAPFQPYRITAMQNVWAGPAGSCNDSNDGFDSSATGAICSFAVMKQLVRGDFTCDGDAGLTIRLADGTYNQTMQMFGPPPSGCGDQIPITGHAGTPSAVTITCPAATPCFDIEDEAISTLTGLSVTCTNAIGFFVRAAILDLNGVISNDCTGGVIFSAQDGGHMNLIAAGAATILGNATNAIAVKGPGSLFSVTPGDRLTVTSSAISIAAFLSANNLGEIVIGPTQISGGGSVTGLKWAADSLGLISTNGSGTACDSFFNNVGSTSGAATNNGVCH